MRSSRRGRHPLTTGPELRRRPLASGPGGDVRSNPRDVSQGNPWGSLPGNPEGNLGPPARRGMADTILHTTVHTVPRTIWYTPTP